MYMIKSENRKLQYQFKKETLNQLSVSWNSEFKNLIAGLLFETDPENGQQPNKGKVVKLMHKSSLLLNTNIPRHSALNEKVNSLALMTNGWLQGDERVILNLHAEKIKNDSATVFDFALKSMD